MIGISFLAINRFRKVYHTFLKPLPYKKFVLKFQFGMRIIPGLPKGNIFYMLSHNAEKLQNKLGDNDKFEPVENVPHVEVGMI